MKKIFAKFLLITTMTLLFSCGKNDSGGAEKLDAPTITDTIKEGKIETQEDSTKTSINGEEKHAIRRIAFLIESELRKNKVFYLSSMANILEDDDCRVLRETYRKLEINGYKMTATEVSDYFIYTKKESRSPNECERHDLDRTTYVRNGIFTLDDLTNEIELIYLKVNPSVAGTNIKFLIGEFSNFLLHQISHLSGPESTAMRNEKRFLI